MKQVQQPATLTINNITLSRTRSSHLLSSLLVGCAIALPLIVLEVCLLWLLNPLHLPGSMSARLLSILALPSRAPLVLLVLLLEIVLVALAAFLAAKPRSLGKYLRTVRTAQESYYQSYIPLTNMYKQPDRSTQEAAAPVSFPEQQIALSDLLQQRNTSQFILGDCGAGKTMALHIYQYLAAQHPSMLVRRRDKIPVYVSLQQYGLFLEENSSLATSTEHGMSPQQATLLDFLAQSDESSIQYLRPYVTQLARQGRLLLLCDGLDEMKREYLPCVCEELVQMMRTSLNQLVVTCREVDYYEQQSLVGAVEDGDAMLVIIHSLQHDQICQFVESYVEKQDKHWRHTAGQILQVIERSRLRYFCTNPMMLSSLMSVIDKVGAERGKQIDTRGRLLRTSVVDAINRASTARGRQQTVEARSIASTRDEVIRLLSQVACAARWSGERCAIQLPMSTATTLDAAGQSALDFAALAGALERWLDEHPAKEPFADGEREDTASTAYENLAPLLELASDAALIEISSGGVLSFAHELIATYFVAEYCTTAFSKLQTSSSPVRKELLDHVRAWSEPIALWAGLLDDPLVLAKRFSMLGQAHPAYVSQALALSLICTGVPWTPPQADTAHVIVLPQGIAEVLSQILQDKAACAELAHIFTRCAREGGQEIYCSLFPLIMIEGIGELLILLDSTIVPGLLFTLLQETVDNAVYEVQVKRLTHVLGRFGNAVVERAIELCLPAPEQSTRLRAAAINTLGGTHAADAVDPLIDRISDVEPFIVNRAVNALIRLGPDLTLTRLLHGLEHPTSTPFTPRVHRAILTILSRFMDERDPQRQLPIAQYQTVLEKIVPILTAGYRSEPELQQQVREILGRQCNLAASQENYCEKAVEALTSYLLSHDDVAVHNATQVLQEIGAPATPRLLQLLKQYQADDAVCSRLIEILKSVRDLRALPYLLRLLDDSSPLIQKQVASVLLVYAPDSIPNLIELVLTGPGEVVADKAAQILSDIGRQAIAPITNALSSIVPGRTRLLVQTLGRIHDPQSVPVLIALLQMPQTEQLLIIAVVRALSQFPEQRVVFALLPVLADNNPQIYEEAIDALSQLGEVALSRLVAELDIQQETAVIQRIRRALLGMLPFPAEQLVRMLTQCNDAQARQISIILRMQGADAAQVLVRHLLEKDERVRNYVHEALNEMPGPVVVPALLEALQQPALSQTIALLLLKYPDAAISPLVDLLGEDDRGNAAAAILPQFGLPILRPLLSGLDDSRGIAQERARTIMLLLVRQSDDEQAVLRDMVHLFNPPPPARAHNVLLEVFTNELAERSIPALLEGLEDAHLLDDVSEVLMRLARKASLHNTVLDQLLKALLIEERRRGAEEACIKIGTPAVPRVGELIVHQNRAVARSAKHILIKIGVPALGFIWAAHIDTTNRARREAALDVFRGMPTSVIRDELIDLLMSEKPENITMATTLLMERIHDEKVQPYADREMIPELVEYVQMHSGEDTNLRIIALLLLLGERVILDHLIQILDDFPQHRKQFLHIFLLLGVQSQEALLDVFNDSTTTTELRAEIATVLGMMTAPEVIVDYAENVSTYGLSAKRTSALFPDQLAISLRALGGLLAGGSWNVQKLQELRIASKEGSPARELFNVLLGMRYEPQLTKLQGELQDERDTYKKEMLSLTARVAADQKRIQSLEEELEHLQHEHGLRGDELHQATHEKEKLLSNIDQVTKDRDTTRDNLAQVVKERDTLREQLADATRDSQTIRSQVEQLKRQVSAIGDILPSP